jgi:glycosyltransferase involved in cell wall biosynthesis
VLTPSLNYGRFIADAVRSVSLQRGITVEHIVQDGDSRDDSEIQARSIANVQLFWESAPDDGQSDALNKALDRASGTWIAWLNADEFYLPGGLAVLRDSAEAEDLDVIFGDSIFVDEHGGFVRLVPQHRFSGRLLRWYGKYVASCALLMRSDVVTAIRWDTRVERIMDWDLYLTLAEKGIRVGHARYPVGAFRIHPARITALPEAQHAESYTRVAIKHDLPKLPSAIVRAGGRSAHGLLKLREGAYVRQVRAKQLRGADTRWFSSDKAYETVSMLIRRCYPCVPVENYAYP